MAKRLIVFDLDGTLEESKMPIDSEMAVLLLKLLEKKEVAVISGLQFELFKEQIMDQFENPPKRLLKRLYLFPNCGSRFYRFDSSSWVKVYANDLSDIEVKKIFDAFDKALPNTSYVKPKKTYGEIIENRGSQITFSAFGQRTPIEIKKVWDPDHKKRAEIKMELDKYLSDFEVKIAGTTSIDINKKGLDKAYGIRQMEKYLGFKKGDMLFVGDALFEGCNDYPVKQAGVECIQVAGPEDTKKVIKKILNSL